MMTMALKITADSTALCGEARPMILIAPSAGYIERNAAGKSVIYIDIPQQNVKAMPVLKASLADGSLVLKIAGGEFRGKLEGNKINGTLKAQNQNIPLVLTKE